METGAEAGGWTGNWAEGGDWAGEAGGEEKPSSFSLDIFPDKTRGQENSIIITQLTILSGSCSSGGKVWLRLSGLRQCRVVVEVTQQRRGRRAVTRVA